MTVSDTRTEDNDTSGKVLVEGLQSAGHRLAAKIILPDNRYQIRAQVACWIADADCDAVLITGGTGVTGRDVTPEAVSVLFDKEIPGFGELFRMLSYEEIRTSTIQSRAIAGVSNGTLVFCLPGSTGACRTAWDKVIKDQLDINHKPCNFVELMPRMKEQ
jgi:molybdenum cofactor biosynthesis protein B